jgi:hypothetical protein
MKRNWFSFTETVVALTLLTGTTLSANSANAGSVDLAHKGPEPHDADVEYHDDLDVTAVKAELTKESLALPYSSDVEFYELANATYDTALKTEVTKESLAVPHDSEVESDKPADATHNEAIETDHGADQGEDKSKGFIYKHTTEMEFGLALLFVVGGLVASETIKSMKENEESFSATKNKNSLVELKPEEAN